MEMDSGRMLEETYRLVKENNRMLRAMRRNAFLGGILRFVFWTFVLIVIPAWVYITYLEPIVSDALQTMQQVQGTVQQVQGTSARAQAQLSDMKNLQDLLKTFDPTGILGQ